MKKKTLVIDPRATSDFSMDLLWAGLVKCLGPENVVDFPAHQKHRALKLQLGEDHEKNYGLERGSLGHTGERITAYGISEINSMIHSGQIERIFINEQNDAFELYLQTQARFFKIPVVVIAGHDRFWNKSPQFVREFYYPGVLERIFIDDWQPEYDALEYVRLTNLSINFDHLWDSEKREELLKNKVYDICFMGYCSDPARRRFIDHVQKRWGKLHNHIMLETRPGAMDKFVYRNEYFSAMAQSKICLNLRGGSVGGRALRFYEIPYVGSFMLSQEFPARLVHPPIPGFHCAYFNDEVRLDAQIDHFLEDDVTREKIAKCGHDYFQQYHTAQARAQHILEELVQ
jgi:Glycosyl transferases group 1